MLPPPPRYKQRIQKRDIKVQEAERERIARSKAKAIQRLKEDARKRELMLREHRRRQDLESTTISTFSQISNDIVVIRIRDTGSNF